MRRRKQPEPPPESGREYHRVMTELGLRVTHYQHHKTYPDNYAVPADLVGADGKTVIVWRVADRTYDIDGWEPWHDGMHGGRRTSLGSALHWVHVARGIRAGTIKDFLGA